MSVVTSKSPTSRRRRRGFRIDGEAFERELAARGLGADRMAHIAGVSEAAVSKARHGEPISHESLTKIVAALESIPANPMAARLLAPKAQK